MKILRGIASLAAPAGGTVVTAGTFDGVHLGHRALLGRTVGLARSMNVAAAAITWDRHPMETLRPQRVPSMLTSTARRIELLEETGLDLLAVLAFDHDLASWPPERFVAEVLVAGLGARAVVVGPGWRFGHKARGDIALLEQLGKEMGFAVETLAAAQMGGRAVSSSVIRRAVQEGDMETAGALLGRPFDLDGPVVHGDSRGASLGYPTANVAVDLAAAHPPRGVYSGRARAKDRWWQAAINVGVNPTFGGDPEAAPPRIEAYLLEFGGDLYGETLRVEFHTRLRDEERFESPDALVEQIARDVEAVRRLG